MFNFIKGVSSARLLPEPQRRMYESEKTDNFRWLANFAKPSSYILTSSDLAPANLQAALAEIGQFAEVAHGTLSPDFIWNYMESLSQPGFPLDSYNALRGSVLVSTFRGTVAELQGYIAYRSQTKQLVVAFSGTSSINQGLRNVDTRLVRYPSGVGCSVHAGFWKMYSGLQSRALGELSQALSTYAVEEIVLTGHSLGAAMSYLFALDVMQGHKAGNASQTPAPIDLPLTIVAFGSPRVGNMALAQYWRDAVASRSSRGLPVKEYSVKGHKDGVPAVPPYHLGFRHFTQTPLYFAQGHLYHVPAAESEYSSFSIRPHDPDDSRQPCLDHPLGGHNYYNGRDMEKLLRKMQWFNSENSGQVDWGRYREWLRSDRAASGDGEIGR